MQSWDPVQCYDALCAAHFAHVILGHLHLKAGRCALDCRVEGGLRHIISNFEVCCVAVESITF